MPKFLTPINTVDRGIATSAAEFGFKAWNYPLPLVTAGTALATGGTCYVQKLELQVPTLVTNLHAHVATAGATLTAGQNFAALYDASKTLLAATADQSAVWKSSGFKTMALSAAQTVAAGYCYVVFMSQGTTRPAFSRQANLAGMNGLLTAANSIWALANTGITTAMPATLGTFTASGTTYWCAVS